MDKEEYKLALEEFHFANNSARNYASQSIKALLILNGGAAVAFLTLVGSMYNSDNSSLPVALIPSLLNFAWGALFSVLTALGAYFTELMLAGTVGNDKCSYRCAKVVFHILSVSTAIAAIVFFILGVLNVANVFEVTS